MTEELKEQIHERVYNIKVPTLGFSRRDLFNIAMEYAEPREKRIAELEKENAELKNERNAFKIYSDGAELDAINLKEQLAKAKVALRNVIDYLGQFCSDYPDCVIEAEQFLREKKSEVDK